MEYKSEDIIDIEKISHLLESYTKATGLETALLDLDGNILIQSGWQKICTKFHRKNSETAKNCLKSDTILAGKIQKGSKYNIYECLNGLINIAVPIIVNGTHLYNLFTGQIFFKTPNEAFFIAQADKYKFDKKEYLEALRQIPILKESDVKNKLLFLSQMTEMIVELGLEKFKRTKTNVTLKESEEKFRALYNNSPLSYQSLNKDGNYIDVNPTWLKMLGYKREEVINHSFFEFLDPESAIKAKRDLFPNFKKCGSIKDIEFKIKHKSGHYIDIAFEGYIGYNPDGSFKQTYCMFTDITKRKLANQLILKNKYRLEYALRSIRTGAWELDLETLGSWRTIKHDQIFGYNKPLEEWNYNMFLEHVIPEDRDIVNQKFQHALATKTDWNFECRINRNNDGKTRWIWANGNQELNDKNESKKMFGVVQDITERKEAEKKLKESNELFRITFNQQFQFMSVLSPEGRIIEINDLPLMIQGGKREEIIGTIFWELKTWQNNPEWQAKIKKQILEVATMKETLLTEDSFTANDGKLHTALAAYTAIRDKKNNVRYILVQATDITKRKQAENELKNQAAKWQTTFNAMSDSVSIIDLDGNISQYNTATLSMFNVNENNLKEKKCFDLVHGTKGFFNDCPLVRMKKSHRAESMIFKKEERWLEVNVDPIFNSKNEITGAVHVVSDITKRKLAEEALRKSDTIIRNKLKAITEPEGNIGTLELSDIIDADIFQSLLEDFYQLTGMPVGIIDVSGKVLVAVNWQDICTKFHRCNPDSLKNCIESDIILTQNVPEGAFKAYQCKNNMWDTVTPLIIGGRHMGNIFLGQYFLEDEVLDVKLFRKQAQKYGFDEAKYLAALDRVPRFSKETVDRSMKFYSKLAIIISNLSFSTIKQSRLLSERKVAEEAIYLSNERYKTLFNNSPIPLWEEDLTELSSYLLNIKEKGHNNLDNYLDDNPKELIKLVEMINILDVNQAALNLHQAKNKKHLIENLSETFTNKSFTVFKNELIALFEGKETFIDESEVKTLSGELKHIHITLKIDKSQPDKIKALIATPDITKQKQAEEKLRDSEYLYKETQRLSKMGGWSYDVENGQSTFTDSIYEIYGKRFSTKEEGQKFYHPEDRALISKSFNEILTNQKPYDLEVRFINAQGDNLYVRTVGKPILKNGKLIKIYGNLIDVTERKKAELELTKHRENLEYLVKERTKELETKNKELARFNDLFVDREFRIKELKNEIDKLKKR